MSYFFKTRASKSAKFSNKRPKLNVKLLTGEMANYNEETLLVVFKLSFISVRLS